MSSQEVCAVIYGETSNPDADEVRGAVEAQGRRPDTVFTAPTLAVAVHTAQAQASRWLWLLDGLAVPEGRALEALLAACELAGSPTPVLLSSKVSDATGELHPDATPRHAIYADEHSVTAAELRLVLIRAAAAGSVLVDRAAAEEAGPPRSDLPPGLNMHEWSARLLRGPDRFGYLVPASRAVRRESSHRAGHGHLLTRARLLAGRAWTPREKLREAYALGREAAGQVRDARRERVASARRAGRGE